jgi:C-terminal processing protease CtpA/Prc
MLTFDQRAQIFDKTVAKVTKEYFDPNFNGTRWPELARDSRQEILAIDDAEAFERSMHELVRRLGTSHTGFFHQSVKRVPARLAIGATFHKAANNGDTRWIVQDVHEGGPAHDSGLQPGDALRTIDGSAPPTNEPPMFAMGTDVRLAINRGPQEITVPAPGSSPQPHSSRSPGLSSTETLATSRFRSSQGCWVWMSREPLMKR